MNIRFQIKKHRYKIAILLVAIFFTLIPIWLTLHHGQIAWDIYLTSAGYYLVRMRELLDGNIFLGNPYFFEHRLDPAPAFFVADWIGSLPYIFGASIVQTYIINSIIWYTIFLALVSKILCSLGVSKKIALLGASGILFSAYHLIFFPVSMQIIQPVYVFFVLALFFWWRDPNSYKYSVLLILATTLSFYVYTYLWQIALATVLLALVYFAILKQWKVFKRLSLILISSLILALPLILYTIIQVAHPHYWETVTRIGLVQTHLPTAAVVYAARWILIPLFFITLIPLFTNIKLSNSTTRDITFFWITGIGMIGTSMSNIVTGKELEIAQHVERFSFIWVGIITVWVLWILIKNWGLVRQLSTGRKGIIYLLGVLSLVGVMQYSMDSVYYARNVYNSYSLIEEVHNVQKPLLWLEQNNEDQKVVWSNTLQSKKFTPLFTKHYLLFFEPGMLHIMTDQEVNERYLLSHYFDDLSVEDLQRDFKVYAGNGNATHPYKTHNRGVKICRLLRLGYLGKDCGELTNSVSFQGEQYFEDLHIQYTTEIKPNAAKYLEKFHVSHLLWDKRVGDINVETAPFIQDTVYDDEIYSIYEIDTSS